MEIRLSDHFTYKKLLRFVLPSIVMMLVTMIYGVIDGFFVSNFAGKNAFAAINLIIPVLVVVASFGFMIGAGGSALISFMMGKNDEQKAREVFTFITVLLFVFGVIASAVMFIFMEQIADLVGAKGELSHYGILYGRILICFTPLNMLFNAFQSLMVTAEKPKFGLLISVIAGITNVVFDFLFVYVMEWGIAGATAATAMSWSVGGIIPLVYFLKKRSSALYFTKFKPDWRALGKVCANGSSEMVTNISTSIVAMLYNFQLLHLAGENGVATYGVIMYVSYVFLAISMGYSVGAAPVVGYHYGADNTDELKGILKKSLFIMLISGILATLLSEILTDVMSKIFVGYDAELCDMTSYALRAYAISFIISGFNIFGSAFFTGLGNGAVSAAISFLRTFLFQIAAVFILPIMFGVNGIWFAVVAAEGLTLIVTAIMFVVYRKKYKYC